jgi:hypothetical protein
VADATTRQRQDDGIALGVLTGLPDQLDRTSVCGCREGHARWEAFDGQALLERPIDGLADNDYHR